MRNNISAANETKKNQNIGTMCLISVLFYTKLQELCCTWT